MINSTKSVPNVTPSVNNAQVTTAQNQQQQQQNQSTATQNNAQALNQSTNQSKILDRDIINLIYYIIKDNSNGYRRFFEQLIEKVEAFLSPFISSSMCQTSKALCDVTQASLSSIRFEMILLGKS